MRSRELSKVVSIGIRLHIFRINRISVGYFRSSAKTKIESGICDNSRDMAAKGAGWPAPRRRSARRQGRSTSWRPAGWSAHPGSAEPRPQSPWPTQVAGRPRQSAVIDPAPRSGASRGLHVSNAFISSLAASTRYTGDLGGSRVPALAGPKSKEPTLVAPASALESLRCESRYRRLRGRRPLKG